MRLLTLSCLISLTQLSTFVKSDDSSSSDTTTMVWESRTPYTSLGMGIERHHPITFANETHGFLLTGESYQSGVTKDFYMYDESNDEWTDLSNSDSSFPGDARNFAYGIVLPKKNHPKAYLGLGVGDNGIYLQDFWEFDMVTHSWNQLADFPGLGRRHPAMVPVVINNDDDEWEIHVGLGDGRENGVFSNLKDWWSYDIQTNTWTQRPDFPSTARHHPFFFGIGSEAYAGFGHATGRPVRVERDWFHFDPESNEWIEDPDFESYNVTTNELVSTEARVAGTEFSIENIDGVSLGFVLSGDGNDHYTMEKGEFHAFCPIDGKWTALPPHPGFSRWAPGSWVMRGTTRVYFTSGYDRARRVLFSDLWRIDIESLFNDSDCVMEDTTTLMPEITSTPTSAPTTTSGAADTSFAACFSGTTLVTERSRGVIPMKELRLGDQVQTATMTTIADSSSSSSWSKVHTFLHWHPNEEVPALVISHTKGNLTLTSNHMLFVVDRNDARSKKCHEEDCRYKEEGNNKEAIPAHQIQIGDLLLTTDDHDSLSFSKIISIQETTMEGYYAPLTASGTLMVDGVLASCFAEDGEVSSVIPPHWVIQLIMAPLRIWQKNNNYYMPAPGEIHPYAKRLIWLKQQFLYVLGMMK